MKKLVFPYSRVLLDMLLADFSWDFEGMVKAGGFHPVTTGNCRHDDPDVHIPHVLGDKESGLYKNAADSCRRCYPDGNAGSLGWSKEDDMIVLYAERTKLERARALFQQLFPQQQRNGAQSVLIKIIRGYERDYFYTPEKRIITYERIYPNTPMFDENECYIGHCYIGVESIGGDTFDKYLLKHPETVLYKWNHKAGAYTFFRFNFVNNEIESEVVVPPPKIPWHNRGPKPTDLNKIPSWVLKALEELGEIVIEEE